MLSIRSCNWTSSKDMKLRLFLSLMWYGSPKNSQSDLMYATMATKQRDISANRLQCMILYFQQILNVVVSKVDYTNLILTEPGSKINGVLPRSFADAESAASDLTQHSWRCVCLPARQCINTLHSWRVRASVPWTSHLLIMMSGQPTWSKSSWLPYRVWCCLSEITSYCTA